MSPSLARSARRERGRRPRRTGTRRAGRKDAQWCSLHLRAAATAECSDYTEQAARAAVMFTCRAVMVAFMAAMVASSEVGSKEPPLPE